MPAMPQTDGPPLMRQPLGSLPAPCGGGPVEPLTMWPCPAG